MPNNNHSISTHGAGILCFYQNQPLLVQLNYGRFKGQWILPGGMMEEGEHPHEAAQREFTEETGLEAHSLKLLTLRHRIMDNRPNNNYWVFLADIKTTEPTTKLKWPTEELQNVQFWNVKEALKSEFVRPHTKYYINLALGQEKFPAVYKLTGPYNDYAYTL